VISYEAQNYPQDQHLESPEHLSIVRGEDWAAIKLESKSERKTLYRYVAGAECESAISSLLEIPSLQKRKIGHASIKHALVPKEIFTINQIKELASSHFFMEKKDVVLSDHIYQAGIENIYCPISHTDIEDVSHYHMLSSLISLLSLQQDRIHLIQSHHNSIIIGVKNGKVVFVKIIPTQSEDEVLYHVMKAYEVSELDPHQHSLAVGGRIFKDSDLYRLFYRFIKDITWLRVPDIDSDDSHVFYDVHLLSKYF